MATGDVAILEFNAGELISYTGKNLAYAVQANALYSTSLNYLEIHQPFGGTKLPVSGSILSLDRFVRATLERVMNFWDSLE